MFFILHTKEHNKDSNKSFPRNTSKNAFRQVKKEKEIKEIQIYALQFIVTGN